MSGMNNSHVSLTKERPVEQARRWFIDAELKAVSSTVDSRESSFSGRVSAAVALGRFVSSAERLPRSILDIGCGRGDLLREFAMLDHDIRLFGFDPDVDAVSRARRVASNAKVWVGSAELVSSYIPLGEAVDLILVNLTVGLWEEPRRGLAAAARQLAPGGILYIFDLARTRSRSLVQVGRNELERRYLEDQIGASFTIDEFGSLLESVSRELPDVKSEWALGGLGGFKAPDPRFFELLRSPHVAALNAHAADNHPSPAPLEDDFLHGWLRRVRTPPRCCFQRGEGVKDDCDDSPC